MIHFLVLEMEDRDGKKPFIIPKTHTSTKGRKSTLNIKYLFRFFKMFVYPKNLIVVISLNYLMILNLVH
jgi:hypothetical protein